MRTQRLRERVDRRVVEGEDRDVAVAADRALGAQATRSIASAIPCPTPMHIVHSARRAPRRSSSSVAVAASRAPLMPSGWPSAIAPPFGLTCARVVREPEATQHRERLRGESLVELDHVEVADREAEPRHQLLGRGRRPHAHDARRQSRDCGAEHAGARLEAMPLRGALAGDEQRAGAIVDAGGVAGRDRAAGAKRRAELRERLEARLARVLVAVDDDRRAFLRRQRHGNDFRREPAARLGGERALLAAQGKGVLVGARDRELGGDVLAGLRHRVDAVLLLHERD